MVAQVERNIVDACCGSRVSLNNRQLLVLNGQRVVLSWVEVIELIHAVQDVCNQLLQEQSGDDPDLAAERTSYCDRQCLDVAVINDLVDSGGLRCSARKNVPN